MRRDQLAPLVLLVESPDTPYPHTETLTRAGFRVHTAGQSAFSQDRVLEIAPRVIAVDLDTLRQFDVFGFTSKLHSDARTQQIPLVVFSRHPHPEHAAEAARVGALSVQTGILPDDSKLVAVIRGVLAGSADASGRTGPGP